jgi:hypothetical protein
VFLCCILKSTIVACRVKTNVTNCSAVNSLPINFLTYAHDRHSRLAYRNRTAAYDCVPHVKVIILVKSVTSIDLKVLMYNSVSQFNYVMKPFPARTLFTEEINVNQEYEINMLFNCAYLEIVTFLKWESKA